MKKIILVFFIVFLIVITTITKNSTKKLENQIFVTKENISVLKDQYEMVLLDYNFLSSPKKLLEYQSKYYEADLIPLDISKVKKINKKLNITNFIKKEEHE
ncbi:cell division protein FtsL [Candidatus Pelagibacter sp.]|nr:cell division protein FtsL [Candidatus Pelagibacter sp.]